jgi:hypothetical protein
MLAPSGAVGRDPALAAWALGLDEGASRLLVDWCSATAETRNRDAAELRAYIDQLGVAAYELPMDDPESAAAWADLVRRRNESVESRFRTWIQAFQAHLLAGGYLEEESEALAAVIEPWWRAEFSGALFESPAASVCAIHVIGAARDRLDAEAAELVKTIVNDSVGRLLELRLSVDRMQLRVLARAFEFDVAGRSAAEDSYRRGRERLLMPAIRVEQRCAAIQRELLETVASLVPERTSREIWRSHRSAAYGELGTDPWEIDLAIESLLADAAEDARRGAANAIEADRARRERLHREFLDALESQIARKRVVGIMTAEMGDAIRNALRTWRDGASASARSTLAAVAAAAGDPSRADAAILAVQSAAEEQCRRQDADPLVRWFLRE